MMKDDGSKDLIFDVCFLRGDHPQPLDIVTFDILNQFGGMSMMNKATQAI